MNPETPKPLVSRLASYVAILSSALNLFHQDSSSSAPPPNDEDPKNQSPELIRQGGSDMGMPPQCPESKSVEAKEDERAGATNFIPLCAHPSLLKSESNFPLASASASSSSSAIPYGEEDNLSSSPLFHHSQINSISHTRVSFSPEEPSPSSIKHSHDLNSTNTNSQKFHSAEAKRWEHEMKIIVEKPAQRTSIRRDRLIQENDVMDASIPPYPLPSSSASSSREEGTVSSFSSSPPPSTENSQQAAETTTRRDPNSLDVMEIIDEQDLAKHILGLAIPMGVALVFSTSKLTKTTEMRVVVIALSFAIDAIWIGLLLRNTYRKTSTVFLMLGIALMMLAFYAFVGCFLPKHLKWIPALCWLASLIPFAMYGWAYFQRKKATDPLETNL